MSTVDTNEFHSRELNLQIHSYTSKLSVSNAKHSFSEIHYDILLTLLSLVVTFTLFSILLQQE